jgi:thiol-disulfide isomerase/thioredoxin
MHRGLRNVLLSVFGLAVVMALLGAYALRRAPAAEADIAIITHGDRVDLQAHAVPGKYTVFDFYAVWCPPCRALSPALEKLASRNTERLAIRKVDIVDWTMPVAEQYGVDQLPYLVLFDGSGQKLAVGEKVYDELDRLFGKDALDVDRATEKPSANSL